MKCILFLRGTIERYQFRCNYLRNTNLFHNFLLHFRNLHRILNILRKNMTLIDFLFAELRTPKTWSDRCPKSPISEESSASNIVNLPKHCRNLRQSTFMIFNDHCQVNWVGKSLFYWHSKSWDSLLTYWLPIKSILFLRGTI